MTERELLIQAKIEGMSSVKELKDEIKATRDALVRLDDTSKEYSETVDDLVIYEKKLTEVMKAGKNEVSAATGSYNALSQEMSALKKVWKETTSEAERSRLGARIREINDQLKAMDETIGNQQRKVGSYEDALRKVFMTPQQEIKKLRTELAGLTVGTDEYNKVFARMAQLTTEVRKQQEMLRYSSSDLGDILSNLAGVSAGVVGGFSAINAAMGLTFGNDGEVQEAMLKVQQFMALVQGLSALEGLKDKITGLFAGIKEYINNFRGGTAAVTDFNKSLTEAKGTTEEVTAEVNTQASAINANAAATNELTTARKELSKFEIEELAVIEQTIVNRNNHLAQIQSEIAATRELEAAKGGLYEGERERLRHLMMEEKRVQESIAAGEKRKAVILGEATAEKKLVTETKAATVSTKADTVATNANTVAKGAGTVATKLLTKAVQGLKVALAAVGIGLIITALTSLLGLLGKGITSLWNWVSGVNAAKKAVDELKKAHDNLNTTMEERNETLDFESRLMEAQGKDYEEIYNYKKQNTQASLDLVKAELAEAEAQAAQMQGKRRFRKQLEELMPIIDDYKQQVKDLEKTLRSYDHELIIHNAAEETRKKNQKASGGGGGGVNKDVQNAQKLYKTLSDLYKTDRQLLRQTYEENKKILEKGIKNVEQRNKALLLLQKNYYDELRKLTSERMDEIYNIYLGQEQRRGNLLNIWGPKYLDKRLAILDEEEKITLRAAAKRVGFEQKTEEEIAKMDAQTKNEYLYRERLFNNEKVLIEQEYAKREKEIREENMTRLVEEGRREIEIKKENAKTDQEVLAAEIELAEYDLANVFQKEGESANQYQLRVIALQKALEELTKKQKEMGEGKDWTQLRLDNDAEAARINQGDQSMQYLNARLKAAQYYYDNLKQLDGESLEEYRQRTLEALADVRDTEREILEQRVDNYRNLAEGIGDIMGSIADFYMTEIEAQKDADGQYNAESKKKFEWVKRLQIAQATIQTISGAIAAFMGCQSLGQPWGAILGAVQAAAVTAAGVAQIAQIKKQKLDGGSNIESVRYATATPSITDYVPEGVTNVTGGQETEALTNALSQANFQVSVTDINEVQNRVRVRESEASF